MCNARPSVLLSLFFRSVSAIESRIVSVPVGGGKRENTHEFASLFKKNSPEIGEGEDVIHLSRVQRRRGGGGGAEIGYVVNRAEAAGEGELDSGRGINRPKGSSPLH